jgi:ATP-dependent DNA ligase
LPKREASFIEPMECLSVSKLPEDSRWLWEIKLDGYRAIAVKSASDVKLFSRQKKSLNTQFPYIVEGLANLPAETVVDGELVAIDDGGPISICCRIFAVKHRASISMCSICCVAKAAT